MLVGLTFLVSLSTTISSDLKEKKDAAYDYPKYRIIIKCVAATYYLGPG